MCTGAISCREVYFRSWYLATNAAVAEFVPNMDPVERLFSDYVRKLFNGRLVYVGPCMTIFALQSKNLSMACFFVECECQAVPIASSLSS